MLLSREGSGMYCKCRDNYLHNRNLREASALHRQLLHALQHVDLGGVFAAGRLQTLLREEGFLNKPSQTVLMQLQRGIAAGWADQVRLCTYM